MGKILEIAICKSFGKEMDEVSSAEALAGKGLVNDRYFKENNNNGNQVTLIEIENINYYNEISSTSIPSINFRRNIVTENIRLNELLGTEFFIGKIKVKAHDLCQPCRTLQENLNQKNFVKKLLNRGGIRCEILTNGKIFVGDKITPLKKDNT